MSAAVGATSYDGWRENRVTIAAEELRDGDVRENADDFRCRRINNTGRDASRDDCAFVDGEGPTKKERGREPFLFP